MRWPDRPPLLSHERPGIKSARRMKTRVDRFGPTDGHHPSESIHERTRVAACSHPT